MLVREPSQHFSTTLLWVSLHRVIPRSMLQRITHIWRVVRLVEFLVAHSVSFDLRYCLQIFSVRRPGFFGFLQQLKDFPSSMFVAIWIFLEPTITAIFEELLIVIYDWGKISLDLIPT